MDIQLETSLKYLEYVISGEKNSLMKFDLDHILKRLDLKKINRNNKIESIFENDFNFIVIDLLNGKQIEIFYNEGDSKFGWKYPKDENLSWIELTGGHYFIGISRTSGYQGAQGKN